MKILKKGQGTYPACSLNGSILELEGTVTVDLEKEQRSFCRILDFSFTRDGKLTEGVHDWYAVSVKIPAGTCRIREDGRMDGMGFRQIVRIPEPLNTDEVEITLWPLEEK